MPPRYRRGDEERFQKRMGDDDRAGSADGSVIRRACGYGVVCEAVFEEKARRRRDSIGGGPSRCTEGERSMDEIDKRGIFIRNGRKVLLRVTRSSVISKISGNIVRYEQITNQSSCAPF